MEEEKVREFAASGKSSAKEKEEAKEGFEEKERKLQAEVFALAGEVDELKDANSYLHSENQKLIDRASACVEDVTKFKREAKEAREDLEVSEETESDRVKVIEGMKKKIKELTNEVETLITVKREFSLRLKKQHAEEEGEEKEESKNEPGSSSTATPSTAARPQATEASAAPADDTTVVFTQQQRSKQLRRQMRRMRRTQHLGLEKMRSKEMRRKKRR